MNRQSNLPSLIFKSVSNGPKFNKFQLLHELNKMLPVDLKNLRREESKETLRVFGNMNQQKGSDLEALGLDD